MMSAGVWLVVRRMLRMVGVLVATLVASCAQPTVAPEPAPPSAVAGVAPQRVLMLSPALTEIAFAVGAGDQIVGVSDFTTYPPEAAAKPTVGAFLNPDLELMATLQPDLLVVQGEAQKIRDWAGAQGYEVAAYPLDSVADILAAMRDLGRRLGHAAEGEAAAGALEAELEAVRAEAAARPPVPTFVSVGRAPGRLTALTTCGPGTFLAELLTLAGGANVFADATGLYPTPSLEALLERQPEVILDLAVGEDLDAAARTARLADWAPVAETPAVRNGRVVVLTDDILLVPGPRVGQAARLLAETLLGDAVAGQTEES